MNWDGSLLRAICSSAAICLAAIACSAQTERGDAWDVVGQYNCSRLNNDSSQEQKLFLFPDMSWGRAAPFTLQGVRVQKINFQTRNFHGQLTVFQRDMTFTFVAGILRLYQNEILADSNQELTELRPSPLVKRLVKKLDRPSMLPERGASPIIGTRLIQTFQYDERLGTLTELRTVSSSPPPLLCTRAPLFSDNPATSPATR